ncbi:MAG: ABC transporter permease [Sediminicola sp.]
MIKNYLKIAWRNLISNKVFSIINISGLGIGLACCLLILLYAKDEVSYDRFHANTKDLYQLTCKVIEDTGKENTYGIAGTVQGPTFAREIPEIKEYVRVKENNSVLKMGGETFYENITWVDDNFFKVFSFSLLKGNRETALRDIRSVVLTEGIAQKYFGDTDPMGKSLELEINNKFESFIVTGIAEKAPQNSSIKFQMLLSFNYQEVNNPDDQWLNMNYPTYFLLNPGANIDDIRSKMAKAYGTHASKELVEARQHGFNAQFVYGLEPFVTMHLNTGIDYVPEVSDPIYAYILSGIALFILLIACINFVNLTVARSLKRGKEIGIRKVVGGARKQLILQFMGESFVLCLIAYGLAFLLAQLSLPFFNDVSNKQLELSYLMDYKLIVAFVILFCVTVFTAGFYPALVLSGFDPIRALHSRFAYSNKNYLSKGLIVLQFSMTTFMLITTVFIYDQFEYLTNEDLGYDDGDLLVLHVGQDQNSRLMRVFKERFSQIPGVEKVAMRQNGFWGTNSRANGFDIPVAFDHIDGSYLSTMGIDLVEGRNFSLDFPADSTNSILVNEAYVKEAGWHGSVLDKTIDFFNGQETKLNVIGVVKDYHFGSLKEKISPQIFTMQPGMGYGRFLIRISPENRSQTVADIGEVYRSLVPYRPYKYDFMEDLNLQNYEKEAKWKQIVGFGAILMIFISCIGLLGLTLLSVQQRTKEIGVRKILGANILQISNLLTKNFMGLVLISFCVAVPFAWYATSRWLENFAYKIEMTWEVFALSAVFTLGVAFMTISYQTFRAASVNPAKSLGTE